MSTILIVEDNPRNMKLVRDVLQVKGYQTLEATTAEDGIELAKDKAPDLILMDIQLPRMNGIEALGVLRANPGDRENTGDRSDRVGDAAGSHQDHRGRIRRLRRQADQPRRVPRRSTGSLHGDLGPDLRAIYTGPTRATVRARSRRRARRRGAATDAMHPPITRCGVVVAFRERGRRRRARGSRPTPRRKTSVPGLAPSRERRRAASLRHAGPGWLRCRLGVESIVGGRARRRQHGDDDDERPAVAQEDGAQRPAKHGAGQGDSGQPGLKSGHLEHDGLPSAKARVAHSLGQHNACQV